uniref:uncharacterized protein LOC131131851 n=1 Tax=Doryrhamphus excisus TaxID=161450 RepID=UPI0025AEA357|nr:uncharacterized protein LOC131131851 [Doryrhamphus excisus]
MNFVTRMKRKLLCSAKKRKEEAGAQRKVSDSQTDEEKSACLMAFCRSQDRKKREEEDGSPDEDDVPDEDQSSQKSSEQKVTEDDMVDSFQQALAVAQEDAAQSLWIQKYRKPRDSGADWYEWWAAREQENAARLQKVLDSVQETVVLFGAQLEGIQRNVDLTVSDLKAQLSNMHRHMASGILHRDERIAKLESQNCFLPPQASEVDVDLPHRLAYKFDFTSSPYVIFRPSAPHYPVPDASIPSYLQAPVAVLEPPHCPTPNMRRY